MFHSLIRSATNTVKGIEDLAAFSRKEQRLGDMIRSIVDKQIDSLVYNFR